MPINKLADLRALYGPAKERSVKKQLSELDQHCKNFIAQSPFVVLSSSSADFALDASPRGGDKGFVKVLDAHTLLIPDAIGNNRLDTLENIVATGELGLLFLVPGVDETLRINGKASLSISADDLSLFVAEKRPPKLVIRVSVIDAYLHCAKALMRSKLWDATKHIDRASLPTMGKMLSDQIGPGVDEETQEQMLRRYATDL